MASYNKQHHKDQIEYMKQATKASNMKIQMIESQKAIILQRINNTSESIDQINLKMFKISSRVKPVNQMIKKRNVWDFYISMHSIKMQHKLLEMTFIAVCTILNKNTKQWINTVKGLDFLHFVHEFDANSITAITREKIRKQLMDKNKVNYKLKCLVSGYIEIQNRKQKYFPSELVNLITIFLYDIVETNADIIVW
eukprot:278325_1